MENQHLILLAVSPSPFFFSPDLSFALSCLCFFFLLLLPINGHKMDKLPNELLVMVCELVLAFDQPIQTCYPVTPSRSGGRWPLPYMDETKHITRRDLALFSVCKRTRNVALDVFWRRNTFLYCPESRRDRKVCFSYTIYVLYDNEKLTFYNATQRAISFLSLQTPSTRQLVRNFRVHFFLEYQYMRVQHEELCARLQPLERIVKRLDRSVKRKVDIQLWRSGEPRRRQTCRHAQLMVLVRFRGERWRIRSLDAGIHGGLAEMWQSHRTCLEHAQYKELSLIHI